MRYAKAKFCTYNGVEGFHLFLNDPTNPYGHYPCDQGRWKDSMIAATSDAAQYGFDGIVFPTH